MIKEKRFLSNLSIYFAVLVIICSMSPWFVWGKSYIMVILLGLFLLSRSFEMSYYHYNLKDTPIYTTLLLLLWCLWYSYHCFQNIEMGKFLVPFLTQILPLFFVIILKFDEKKKVIEQTTKLFAIILAISLLYYCLFLIGLPLPYKIIQHPTNLVYSSFANYYLFIIEATFDATEFLRFRSIFTEPGHVGMMCALYLYINKYQIKKWYNATILAVLIASFSFAAYVLLACGWLIYLRASRLSLKPVFLTIIAVIIVAISIEILTTPKGADKGILSTKILDRTQYDEEKGISGNNRNDYNFNSYYKEFSQRPDYFMGIGLDEYGKKFASTPNSSYRCFIVQYGLIGLIIYLSMFLSLVLYRPSRLGIGMFFLFSLSFIQRPYWIWAAQSFMFVAATYMFYYESKSSRNTRISKTSHKIGKAFS